ncbi:hypothetical protein T03_9359, partial [Trichinella britovi]
LATVLFALRREQQAACIIQKAWKTYLRKNRQQAVETHEYSNVDHFNEHLLFQNEQLIIEEKENFIVREVPFDQKEQGETCEVAVVDENDKMENSGNECERSDEEECAKELSNAQSDQNADAFECMTRSEITFITIDRDVYGINVKSNSSLLDVNECKVEKVARRITGVTLCKNDKENCRRQLP